MNRLQLVYLVGAAALLTSVAVAPQARAQSGCGSLLSAINQLRAQIPREPRDAAQDDQQVLNNDVGLYNRACTGGGGSSGGGYRPGGGGNNAANALGAGANVLGALSNLLDQLDQDQRDAEDEAAQEEQQQEMEAALEQAKDDAQERAAAAEQRAAQAAARAADDTSRQAMANPFAGGSRGANPFDTPKGKAGNPFATTASAAPPPAASTAKNASGASQSGFKSDAQIKSECAKSGNPSVCELTEKGARSSSPAYQKYLATQKVALQKNIDAEQKRVDDAFANFDRTQAQRKPPDQVGSLPAILAGKLPPNDDGLECGPAGHGRRHNGQCYLPWSQSPDACAAQTGGSFYPADDDHPTAFCAYNAPPNPMTAHPGPHEGEQCGDVAGHIHGGACWALGITRDDCRDSLKGITIDNGGFQYCAYDAAQLDAELAAATKARTVKKKVKSLRDDLLKKMAKADPDDASDDDTVAPAKPPVQPVAAKPEDAPPPATEKQAWKPDYVCRLPDDTVIHTDNPTLMSGYVIDHPPDCHLTNGAQMLGLSGNPDFSDLKIDKSH